VTGCRFTFRVVGSPTQPRRLVDGGAAFAAYAACDPRAEPNRECYLSAFWFGDAMRDRLNPDGVTLNVRGYAGPLWSPWVWFDFDRADIGAALTDTRRFVGVTLDRYCDLDEDALLYFLSGGKGFHIGLPTAAMPTAQPSPRFNRIAKRFATALAERAGVAIDPAVYDAVRLFRAPNSRHPKTGRFKRRLTHRELYGLSAGGILALASAPAPFDLPDPPPACPVADADWEAADRAEAATTNPPEGAKHGTGGPLQRDTLDLIHGFDVPAPGERERRVFRAAANLTECGAPPVLVRALLDTPARNCGLPAREVDHAIRTGIEHGGRG
jgi:hypothetical protein